MVPFLRRARARPAQGWNGAAGVHAKREWRAPPGTMEDRERCGPVFGAADDAFRESLPQNGGNVFTYMDKTCIIMQFLLTLRF